MSDRFVESRIQRLMCGAEDDDRSATGQSGGGAAKFFRVLLDVLENVDVDHAVEQRLGPYRLQRSDDDANRIAAARLRDPRAAGQVQGQARAPSRKSARCS